MEFTHKPVLLAECVEGLNIRPGGVYVDGTLGRAGHSRAIAEKLTTGRLICIDRDRAALAAAPERLAGLMDHVTLLHGNFADLTALLSPTGSLNYGRWQDSQISVLLTAFSQAPDSARESAAYSLYAYLTQQMPIAPICFKNGSVLTQWGRLSGLSPVRGNVFYQLENWSIS